MRLVRERKMIDGRNRRNAGTRMP